MSMDPQQTVDPLNCMGDLAEAGFIGVYTARAALVNERRAWAEREQQLLDQIAEQNDEAQRRNARLEAARVENEQLRARLGELMLKTDGLMAQVEAAEPEQPVSVGSRRKAD